MEPAKEPIHSEPATSTTTPAAPEPELTNSSPADDPPPSPSELTTKNHNPEPDEEDPAADSSTARGETTSNKRRKLCPTALEKCEAIIFNSCASNPSNCFSFTFDPKFSCGVSTPEVTPKFGSFNLVAHEAAPSSAGIDAKSEQGGGEKRDKADEDEEQRRSFLEILGSGGGDGGISADFFEDGSNVFL